MRTFQFTIPASGIVQFVVSDKPGASSYFQHAIIQNNNSGNIRIGGSTVTATTGILLGPGTTYAIVLGLNQRSIDQIYAQGTPGFLVDLVIVE